MALKRNFLAEQALRIRVGLALVECAGQSAYDNRNAWNYWSHIPVFSSGLYPPFDVQESRLNCKLLPSCDNKLKSMRNPP
jgi:hypothetical protein